MDTDILIDHEPAPGLDGPDFRAGPGGSGTLHLVRVLLRVRGELPEDEERIPLNLSLVLDRSGSMSGAKLEAAREAAAGLLRRLHPDDLASVVIYDDRVETVAEPGRGSDQERLADAVRSITARGMTNLSGGWLKGREHVAAHLLEGGMNRVILLSDGLANQGITEPGKLLGLCSDARGKGVSTTTVGFGEGFDEDLMRGMADAGGGSTYYVERPDQAEAIFLEEIEGLASLCAQNLEIEVRPGSAARISRVRHGYLRRDVEGGIRLLPGDLYARAPVPVLAEFLVRAGEDAEAVDVSGIAVRADVLTPGGGVEKRTVDLPVRFSPADGPSVHPEIQREALLQDAARARDEALRARERGDSGEAARILRECVSTLREAAPDDADLMEEAADLKSIAELAISKSGLDAADVKYMKQRSYEAGTGRSHRKDLYRRTEDDGEE